MINGFECTCAMTEASMWHCLVHGLGGSAWDEDPPPPLPRCASHRCKRDGYIKSERWGLLLCALHATTGPEPPLCIADGPHGPFDDSGHCVLCGVVIRKEIQREWHG